MTNEKLLPIEPGCVAMVIDSDDPENHGKFVTVGEPRWTNHKYGRVWNVDTPLRFIPAGISLSDAIASGKFKYWKYAYEQNLMRIDGHKEDEHDKEETLEEDLVLERGYF